MNKDEKIRLQQEWVDAGAPFGISSEDMIRSMQVFMRIQKILRKCSQDLSDHSQGNFAMIALATFLAQVLFLMQIPDPKYISVVIDETQKICTEAFENNSSASEQFIAMLNLGRKGDNDNAL